jgi:hypothetical protein
MTDGERVYPVAHHGPALGLKSTQPSRASSF